MKCDLLHDNGLLWINDNGLHCTVEEATVGQFTGLRDKDGKEIYEGDIIMLQGVGYFVVQYHTSYCQFCLAVRFIKDGFVEKLFYANTDRYTIVGNMIDNPELMKGGKQ